MKDHLGPNHNCHVDQIFNDFEFGELWRHFALLIFTHPPDPKFLRTESYIAFPTCTDLSYNFEIRKSRIQEKYPEYRNILGKPTGKTRLCNPIDNILLDRSQITQPSMISFSPEFRDPGGYMNRLLLTQLLPDWMSYLVEEAQRLPKYKFTKRNNKKHQKSVEFLSELWSLCRLSHYNYVRVLELFENDNPESSYSKSTVPLNTFFDSQFSVV